MISVEHVCKHANFQLIRYFFEVLSVKLLNLLFGGSGTIHKANNTELIFCRKKLVVLNEEDGSRLIAKNSDHVPSFIALSVEASLFPIPSGVFIFPCCKNAE
jgi:hypothetical protein